MYLYLHEYLIVLQLYKNVFEIIAVYNIIPLNTSLICVKQIPNNNEKYKTIINTRTYTFK